MIHVEPNTIVVYADITCPWAHLSVFRLHRARSELGLDEQVRFDHRAFPLELFNGQPTPKPTLDAEIPVAGGLDPEARWQTWQRPDFEYPATILPALEAVQAAKEQSLEASEQLDRGLRIAFFGESRPISMVHEILEVAEACDAVDAGALKDALESGSARATVAEQAEIAKRDEVRGSPHLFLPDGSDEHNPGIVMHWEGDETEGFPVVDRDDPTVYYDLVRKAAGADI